jgi:hypothetical protein
VRPNAKNVFVAKVKTMLTATRAAPAATNATIVPKGNTPTRKDKPPVLLVRPGTTNRRKEVQTTMLWPVKIV